MDDHAYIFYFVHPGQGKYEYNAELGNHLVRRSSLQVAELTVVNGKLTALRDEPFDFYLPNE